MESALLIRRTNKEPKKKGKILFINAFNEVKDEKTISYLMDHHIDKIFKNYHNYHDVEGFSKVISNDEVLKNNGSLLVTNYVQSSRIQERNVEPFEDVFQHWDNTSNGLKKSMKELFKMLS